MSYPNYATYEKKRNRGRLGGIESQRRPEIGRLSNALKFGPARSVETTLLFVVNTYNPITEQRNHIEIKHEINNGSGKVNVYLNNEKWRNGWSATRFAKWICGQIGKVLSDWS